jgi:hypothetical protein
MSNSPVRTQAQTAPVVATPDTFLVRSTRMVAVGAQRALMRIERSVARSMVYLRSTGTLGLSGLGLLGLALVCVWTVVLPQRDGLSSLREQLATAQARAIGGGPGASMGPAQQASDFIKKLPARRDLPAILGIVLQQAEASSLSLESGSYEWRAGKDGGPGQYRIALPVRGTYPEIRRFVEATLFAAPAVALESLRFARGDVAESAVDADVSFVVFVRGSQ